MNQVIGTCSECGGPVKVPSFMVNPIATCQRCGATAAQPYGPVIPMTRPTGPVFRSPTTACTCGTSATCPIHLGNRLQVDC